VTGRDQTNLTPLLLLLTLSMSSCAAVVCRPETVIVSRKDEIVRLETGPAPLRTTERGRLADEVRPTLVREYWIETDQGVWRRVAPEKFHAVEIGHALEICR
jgi:hypothetical protein